MKIFSVSFVVFIVLIFVVSCGGNDDSCTTIEGKMWSPISSTYVDWGTAIDYCEDLKACGYSDWIMPNINELRTLIQNCPETETGGPCSISYPDHLSSGDDWTPDCYHCESIIHNGGYYSKLGDDLTSLWSSSTNTWTLFDAWCVDFIDGAVKDNDKSYRRAKVRCVRNAE